MLQIPLSRTRSLADIALPEGINWLEEYQHIPIHQEQEYTTGGLGVIWQQRITGLRIMTLDFSNAWLNLGLVQQLRALSTVVGAQYPLVLDLQRFVVQFIPEEFKLSFLNGFRKTQNIEDCPFVGQIKLNIM